MAESPEPRIELDRERIEAYCRRWRIVRLELFGSVLSDEFRPDSDVDVLVTFEPDAPWSLFDLVDAQMDLESIVGRQVDLVERRAIERSRNPFRRQAILDSAVPYYDVA